MTPWVHPSHGRVHMPNRHRHTIRALHTVALASDGLPPRTVRTMPRPGRRS